MHAGKEARHVGQGLKWLPAADSGEDYHVDNVPWYRVVNSNEIIAHRSPGSQVKQTEKLEEEGIAVQRGFRHLWVEFRLCGWFPSKDEIAVGDGEEEDADGEEEEEDGNDEDSEEDGEWEPE
ncbi:uncharacterized protein BDV14DRAFT_203653 [Aspergillus stella-maris]|uniref:uncharacterized protein n=1 Tax=Aspergillus stella-maris TaxID=1810926 RepID=UPI003CCE38D7